MPELERTTFELVRSRERRNLQRLLCERIDHYVSECVRAFLACSILDSARMTFRRRGIQDHTGDPSAAEQTA
jgi:hypothetical protein